MRNHATGGVICLGLGIETRFMRRVRLFGELPDLAAMLRRFTPVVPAAPQVLVILPPLATFDRLIALAGASAAPGEVVS